MVLDFKDEVLLDTRVQFGGVAGCGTFGWAAEAWKELMVEKFKLLAGFRWVDDTLFAKPAGDTTAGNMIDIVKQLRRFVCGYNKSKTSSKKHDNPSKKRKS